MLQKITTTTTTTTTAATKTTTAKTTTLKLLERDARLEKCHLQLLEVIIVLTTNE